MRKERERKPEGNDKVKLPKLRENQTNYHQSLPSEKIIHGQSVSKQAGILNSDLESNPEEFESGLKNSYIRAPNTSKSLVQLEDPNQGKNGSRQFNTVRGKIPPNNLIAGSKLRKPRFSSTDTLNDPPKFERRSSLATEPPEKSKIDWVVSSIALNKRNEGLICSSKHFIMFSISDRDQTQANILKVIPTLRKNAFFIGCVALNRSNQYVVHDNGSNSISRIFKSDSGQYKCEQMVKDLVPITVLTQSLQTNLQESLLFVNQKSSIKVINIEDYPKTTWFDVGWSPKTEITDFKILNNNILITLASDGVLKIFKINPYKHESRLVHCFRISATSYRN